MIMIPIEIQASLMIIAMVWIMIVTLSLTMIFRVLLLLAVLDTVLLPDQTSV